MRWGWPGRVNKVTIIKSSLFESFSTVNKYLLWYLLEPIVGTASQMKFNLINCRASKHVLCLSL